MLIVPDDNYSKQWRKGDRLINISDKIRAKLSELPMKPGVYKMIDNKGNVIYVGKSKMLNKRVKIYFTHNPEWDKIKRMVKMIDNIEFIVTDTHLEARLLECSLIKELKPVFNSQMKHDRGYVYLKLENYNKHRALSVVESREENSFGPFRKRYYLNETVKSLRYLYPIVKKDDSYFFEYHIFPVNLNELEFNENRNSLYEILTNDSEARIFINELEKKMKNEAASHNFERASLFKDILNNVNYLVNSLNRYKELLKRDIVLSVPIDEGLKLFYISKGLIMKKEVFKAPKQNDIEKFREAALTSRDAYYISMDEKSLIDYKDIICSEIISLPDCMVKYI